ncbi:hypothetical protein A1OW_22635 [Enterovibrio norvegicus]|uniref:hypothetical protein n=1 Tax=Enterovibrio norvegicus TaxID=188144 RepID=UPI0002E35104|nr:hypothetical protein [Enterovibrio norvegicus]OEF53472.1 hypothetical protein A1OW_22635 [Enterovibrio norvegicus]
MDYYKWGDDAHTTVCYYHDGTVDFLAPSAVPDGVIILAPSCDIDDADQHRQLTAINERNWRDTEMRRVLRSLDQARNDAEFGTVSYKGGHTPAALNAYRIALCDYPDAPGFPFCDRPII